MEATNREEISERIQRWISDHRQSSLELLQSMVRIPSVNNPPHGNELQMQQYIYDWLVKRGGKAEMYDLRQVSGLLEHPAYRPGKDYVNRPNVTGWFKGEGVGRSILFSGHADTVYEGKETWKYPPFSGEIDNGKLYGRGAYDMKGGVAASMMAVQCLQELKITLQGDVGIESVVDEEHGGANGTLAGRVHGVEADIAIIPEPTNMRLCPAHLGGGIWKAKLSGKSGIGFAGEELVSALEASAEFVLLLKQYEVFLNEKTDKPARWKNMSKKLDVIPLSLYCGDISRNIQEKVPDVASCSFWIEGYPGMTGEGIIDQFQKFYMDRSDEYPMLQRCSMEIEEVIPYLLASEMKDSPQIQTFMSIAHSSGISALGKGPVPEQGTPFACDAFMFNLHSSTPALILGPSGGNAHAADEFIELSSYYSLIQWYAEMIIDWCGVTGKNKAES